MCGIFGYIGARNAAKTCVAGLKRLEYRGYDSAGIAGVTGGHQIESVKEVGRIVALEAALGSEPREWSATIAHTRWATHGQVSRENAHPHFDHNHTLAIVHNGIIENHQELREQLSRTQIQCSTGTDTEVIAEWLAANYHGDPLVAVATTVRQLQGAFALAIIHRDHPDWIYVVAHDCPLAIGQGEGECFIASDARAFGEHTQSVHFLKHDEIAAVGPNGVTIYDLDLRRRHRAPQLVAALQETISRGGYAHYMLKEMHEQPQTLRDALFGRLDHPQGPILLPELEGVPSVASLPSRLLFLGCGTAYHAGLLGSTWCEELLRIPAQAEIGSEYRYRNPLVDASMLGIAISQSGETADTLAAVKHAQELGSSIVGLCNVEASTLCRTAEPTLLLRAGPEVGVASTKAFTSQLAVALLLLFYLGQQKGASAEQIALQTELLHMPAHLQQILYRADEIMAVGQSLAKYSRFFFIGRQTMVPVALEGALKVKEIAYVEAQGYPAGELKHGPIALIDAQTPTIALCCHGATYGKLLSNLSEIKARGGPIVAIAFEGDPHLEELVDQVIYLPRVSDLLAPFPVTVVCQLLAYSIALARGCEIDHPRNLAKSVTVE
ncbi:MAG: glutamine--fructose-6-phosphate transaminase (isomerizing) [Chlamydiia bacterium]